MRAMGLSDNDVVDKLRHPEFYKKSIDAANDEGISSEDQALLELYKKLRPGEPVGQWWPAAAADPFL